MVDVVDYVSSVEVVSRVRVRNKKEKTQNNEWVYYDIKWDYDDFSIGFEVMAKWFGTVFVDKRNDIGIVTTA